MEPLTIAALAGGGLLGGVLGGQMQAQALAQSQANANRIQALNLLMQSQNRPPAIGEVNLQRYSDPRLLTSVGELAPETMSATELRNILTSPEYTQAQKDALMEYQQLSETGLSAIDRAVLTDIQNQVANQERGQREAILQNMAERGMAGSGAELAQNLLAQQQAAQTASEMSMRQAAQAQQARLQALGAMSNLGGQLSNVEYERALNQARAQEAINQFNVQNRNVAQAQNLANRQAIANQNIAAQNQIAQANVDLANQQQMQNVVNRPLAQYGLQNQYVSGLANTANQMAGTQAQLGAAQAGAQAQMFGAGLQAAGTIAGAGLMGRPGTTPAAPGET